VSQLNQTTQQNASSSEELAATSEEMSGQAEQLQQTMAFFKLDGAAQARAATVRKLTTPIKPGTAKAGAGRTSGGLAMAPSAAIDESQFIKF
jgi:methyl-accepting chemotaxis protein